MHPIFLQLGPLTIHWYGVFMALAFLTGFASWVAVGRREGRNAQFVSDLIFWVMVAGILGGRVAYVVADLPYFLANPTHILAIWEGGLIYYGGFIGAILAVFIFGRRRHIPLRVLLDFSITSLPLAHAIGRIGCFLNGCCFGDLCSRWPAIAFPAASAPWSRHLDLGLITRDAALSLPVHPVQLYEAIWNLAIYPILLLLFRYRRRDGLVTGAYFILYPLGRFLLEFLRGTERLHAGPISAAQAISLGLMAIGLLFLLTSRPRAASAS